MRTRKSMKLSAMCAFCLVMGGGGQSLNRSSVT